MVVTMVVIGAILATGLVSVVLVRRRGREDPAAVERAVRAARERAAVQQRMTRMHPDFVRDWMRPR